MSRSSRGVAHQPGCCSDCGRPIKGSWSRHLRQYVTRCQVCARGKTRDDLQRAEKLLRKYGLTMAAYEAMALAQGGVCAACGRPPKDGESRSGATRLNVDHCHATGRVRGLLCRDCNNALGHVQDDPVVLRRLAAYLEARPAEPSDEQLRLAADG